MTRLAAVCFCILGFVPPCHAAAQSAALVLRVLAHESGRPLPGAEARIAAASRSAFSDHDGIIRIQGIPTGSHVVEVRRLGYRTELLRVDFSPGAVVEGEIELVVEPVLGDSLHVQAGRQSARLRRAGFHDRQSWNDGTFLTRDQLSTRRARSPAELLQGVRGTRVVPTRTAGGYRILQKRFGGDCDVLIWIDGIPSSAADLESLRIENIEGIEVYPGAQLPRQFNQLGPRGFSACGAAVIWTGLAS
jgi:hypothetical protein